VREEPSQMPAHADPSLAQAGRPARGSPITAVQRPGLPLTLQDSHCPVQAALQQTPSTQLPLAHWTAPPHPVPLANSATQTPAEHQSPAAQSPLLAQLPRHAVGPQTYGAQAWACGAGQRPAPSQAAASVATPALQLAPRHCAVGYAQAAPFAPSQRPPQADPSEAHAWRLPCGAPSTGAQTPALPGTSQAWHWPLHAWSQQTPSAQNPEAHWFAPPQITPATSFGVQIPAAQKLAPAQSLSSTQSPRQAVAPQT